MFKVNVITKNKVSLNLALSLEEYACFGKRVDKRVRMTKTAEYFPLGISCVLFSRYMGADSSQQISLLHAANAIADVLQPLQFQHK